MSQLKIGLFAMVTLVVSFSFGACNRCSSDAENMKINLPPEYTAEFEHHNNDDDATDDDDSEPCTSDDGCEFPQICKNGVCVDPSLCSDLTGGEFGFGECLVNMDCESGKFCDMANVSATYEGEYGENVDCGTCTRICYSDADCGDGWCCHPLSGNCYPCECRYNEDCDERGYENGCCINDLCSECPEVNPDRCAITGKDLVFSTGGAQSVGVVAWLGDNTVAGIYIDFQVESTDETVAKAEITDPGAIKITAVNCGDAMITASADDVLCEGSINVQVIDDLAETKIYVFDSLTGEPLKDAGVWLGDSKCVEDEEGVYCCGGTIPGDLHVTHPDYTYVSIMGGLNSNAAVIYLEPNPGETKKGRFEGKFSYTDTVGELSIGMAGVSQPMSFFDMTWDTLFGEMNPTTLTCEGIFEGDVDLPEGISFEFGDICEESRDNYAGAPLPGYRVPWGFGGKLTTDDVLDNVTKFADFFDEDTEEELPIGQLISAFMSWLAGFEHTLGPVTKFEAGDAHTINMSLDVPLGIIRRIKTPTLPVYGDTFTDGILFIGGTLDNDLGAIPLGLTAGLDDPENTDIADGKITRPVDMAGAMGDEEVIINIAPRHSGIESNDYVLIGLATNFKGTDGGACISGLVDFPASFSDDIDWSGKQFLAFAESACYDAETGTAFIPPIENATFYRYHFYNDENKHWIIYKKDSGELSPNLPEELEDLRGVKDGSATFRAEAIQTKGELFPADLVSPAGEYRLDSLQSVITAFSIWEQPPSEN